MELEICFCMKCMKNADTFTDRDLDFLKGKKKRLPIHTDFDGMYWTEFKIPKYREDELI